MHEGFRKPGDITCSVCPREIEPEPPLPDPRYRTLCGPCRTRINGNIGNPGGSDAIIIGSGISSGWAIGKMLG